jgi:hypothetical protein
MPIERSFDRLPPGMVVVVVWLVCVR